MSEVLLLTPIPYLPLALLFVLVLPSVIPGRPKDLEGTSSILVSIEACLQIAGKTSVLVRKRSQIADGIGSQWNVDIAPNLCCWTRLHFGTCFSGMIDSGKNKQSNNQFHQSRKYHGFTGRMERGEKPNRVDGVRLLLWFLYRQDGLTCDARPT